MARYAFLAAVAALSLVTGTCAGPCKVDTSVATTTSTFVSETTTSVESSTETSVEVVSTTSTSVLPDLTTTESSTTTEETTTSAPETTTTTSTTTTTTQAVPTQTYYLKVSGGVFNGQYLYPSNPGTATGSIYVRNTQVDAGVFTIDPDTARLKLGNYYPQVSRTNTNGRVVLYSPPLAGLSYLVCAKTGDAVQCTSEDVSVGNSLVVSSYSQVAWDNGNSPTTGNVVVSLQCVELA
ncbi:hypothetical protein QQX98_005092 [Neonectria punicea]|uniref:Uncharacterized protein n=1 Tax=Neonectria punicea TaxID=979145 RepID=A0ABR1H6E8_9HYPO